MRQEPPNGDRKRTRIDSFADVYDSDIVPLLEGDTHGQLYARTIMELLMEKYPGRFFWSQLRTLERRVQEYREEHGPGPEAFIPQEHLPGLEAQVDFTNGASLKVTIGGAAYRHKLGHFVLSHSKARYVYPATTESFPAVLHLIQAAVQRFGGAPTVLRSDGVPSCIQKGKPIIEYQGFLRHYGMRASVINPYCPNENGVVEHANFRIKNAIDQALIVKGNRDFGSVEEYAAFVQTVVDRYNRRPAIAAKLEVERSHLRPLPAEPAPIYETNSLLVDKYSLIHVKASAYSVPSKFIGQQLTVHLYDERLEIYHQDDLVASWDRVHSKGAIRVDYRHVIHWLVQKPGSFASCTYRDALFITNVFRDAYAALRKALGFRADATYLRILYLAAMTEEAEVEAALALLLEEGGTFDVSDVWQIMAPPGARMPRIPGYQLDMDFPEAA